MPLAGQTIYRGEIKRTWVCRTDGVSRLRNGLRDTPDGKFRLSILAEDNETRPELKSIVPVLEHAPKPRRVNRRAWHALGHRGRLSFAARNGYDKSHANTANRHATQLHVRAV